MIILVFGNPDCPNDNAAPNLIPKLKRDFPQVVIQPVNPNEDLPLDKDSPTITVIDLVAGIKKLTLLTEKDIDKLQLTPRHSTHDYDLGFQFKYLKKLGKLKKIRIIGLPQNTPVDYSSLQSIVRKLVAQDMHGS